MKCITKFVEILFANYKEKDNNKQFLEELIHKSLNVI